jgi:hypothetical protein
VGFVALVGIAEVLASAPAAASQIGGCEATSKDQHHAAP